MPNDAKLTPGQKSLDRVLIQRLHEIGVTHFFGVGGANVEDLYDAAYLEGNRVQAILAKHEFAAGCMADAYSRVTQRIGVVATTSGGGMMNVIGAIAESYASRVPILAIIGQIPTNLEGKGGFQDSSGLAGTMNAQTLFQNVSKFCRKITSPHHFHTDFSEAVEAAVTGRKGPSVLLIPKDVQQALINDSGYSNPILFTEKSSVSSELENQLQKIVFETEKDTNRPLIIAGGEIISSNCVAEFLQWVNSIGAFLAVTPDARDLVDNQNPLYKGLAGVMGHSSVMDALNEADTCWVVGTRLPVMARAGLEDLLKKKKIIFINPEKSFFEFSNTATEVISDLGPVLKKLLALSKILEIKKLNYPAPKEPHIKFSSYKPQNKSYISYVDVMQLFSEVIPNDANVFIDAGNSGAFAFHYLKVPAKGKFITVLGMGAMGYSFGGGIGAAFATNKRTFIFAGDGAFFMQGMEIHTAVEYDLPVTFIVFNNQSHAMCVTREQIYYKAQYSFNLFKECAIGNGIAAMYPKMPTYTIRSKSELEKALKAVKNVKGPVFFSIEVNPEDLPPFVPFIKALESK